MVSTVKKGICLVTIIACFFGSAEAAAKPMVALDCYHNNETPPHYIWGKTDINNFSQFAGIIIGLGGDTMSIHTALDSSVLANVNVLIIVDPDTTTENPNPKYISAAETTAVDRWVQKGGILMLLANDSAECEFTHLNQLSSQFGIHFNGDVYGGGYDFTNLPNHPFFTGCTTLHIKGISTFTITSPAQSMLTVNSKILMVTATKRKGTVFALGDPWLLNEYINTGDNKKCGTNVMQWLFARIPGNVQATSPNTFNRSNNSYKGKVTHLYSVNGEAIGAVTRQSAREIVCTSVSGEVTSKALIKK